MLFERQFDRLERVDQCAVGIKDYQAIAGGISGQTILSFDNKWRTKKSCPSVVLISPAPRSMVGGACYKSVTIGFQRSG
jgi:hypothetical protein